MICSFLGIYYVIYGPINHPIVSLSLFLSLYLSVCFTLSVHAFDLNNGD